MCLALARRVAVLLACLSVPYVSASAPGESPRLVDAYGRVPIAFEPNRGQADPAVRYLARGHGYSVLLTDDEAVIALQRGERSFIGQMRFVGAKPSAALRPQGELGSTSNYFIGEPSRHLTDVPNYAAVRRAAVYEGVDVVFYGNQQSLEYDLVVAPGADPRSIELAFVGPESLEVNEAGDLVLRFQGAELVQHRPAVHQEIAGEKKSVSARYVLRDGRVGFEVAAYDATRPLVIDPVITYGSHQGGASLSYSIAVDSAGNAFAAGQVTQSSVSFPIVSAFDGSIGHGDTDAFVQKFNATGTALIYSTYLGGPRSVDAAVGIAIDASGNAYVTGQTNGTDFPTSTTAYQHAPASGGGSFIAKLGPAGNTLLYSTYLLNATTTGIAVDGGGSSYVTGSANGSFLTTAGVFQPNPGGTFDNAFVFKLNATGSAAIFSTFYGGANADKAYGIAVDSSGNAYIAGSTTSANLPTSVGAYRTTTYGGKDAFVAKFNASGTALVFGTYLGGSLDDYATAIAVDSKGAAYVTGDTFSQDFPTRSAFQASKPFSNVDAAFVTKLSPGGNDLVYSSYLGGLPCNGCLFSPPVDIGTSIAVDPQGNAYIGGQTQSAAFPRVDSILPAIADNGDGAWVVKISKLGAVMLYSTIIGGNTGIGNPTDFVRGLAADGSGNVYGTGNIGGFQTTPGPFQNSGGSVVFKLSSGGPTLAISSSGPSTKGQTTTLTANTTGLPDGSVVKFLERNANLGLATVTGGVATLGYPFPVGIHGVSVMYTNGVTIEVESPLLYQVTNPAAVCN